MNPYLPEYEYVPDGEPHVFGNRVYLYGSHDRFNGERFCMNDYVCYSADVDNLGDWRYEGVIYQKTQDPRMTKGDRELWAPDVVRGKDGRYYLYYCPDSDGQCIGVAVCDSPAGKYSFYGIVQDRNGDYLGRRPQDTDPFDPGVFMDDDGTIYLYSGNGPLFKELPPQLAHLMQENRPKACVVMTLEDDMLTLKTEPVQLIPHIKQADGTGFEEHPFFEASSVRKINGRYYLVYSSNKMHELCYAVSEFPDRGFRFGGVIISNVDVHPEDARRQAKNRIGNNHGGIECMNGKYYIFYHRQTNNHGNSRQGCAERINISEDGSIRQVEMTSNGLTAEPFKEKGTYPASLACHLYRTDVCTDSVLEQMKYEFPYLTQDGPDYSPQEGGMPPRQYIANMQNHGAAMFRYFDLSLIKNIEVVIRGTAVGMLYVRNGAEGEQLAEIPVEACQDWKICSAPVNHSESLHSLFFCYEGEGTLELLEFILQ